MIEDIFIHAKIYYGRKDTPFRDYGYLLCNDLEELLVYLHSIVRLKYKISKIVLDPEGHDLLRSMLPYRTDRAPKGYDYRIHNFDPTKNIYSGRWAS